VTKRLSPLDLTKNELQNARIQNLAAAPGSPVSGQLYFNTSDSTLYWYDGAAWVAAEGTTSYTPTFGNVTTETSYGQASANGASTDLARSDHTHGTPSLTSNAASATSPGGTSTVGTGTAPARDDHTHSLPNYGVPTAQTTFGASSANGSATTFARSDHAHGTPTHDAAAHSTIPLSALATATANLNLGGFRATNAGEPSAASDLTTKSYVDSVAAGLDDFKDSVRAASTADITLTGPGAAIDGVTMATGDRFLAKNQTTASQNGIYIWNGAAAAATRATDADASGEISVGTLVYVEAGTANGAQLWVANAVGATPWVPGTTTSTWALYFAVTPTQAGDGLAASGNVLAVGAGTGITVAADSIAVDTAVVVRKYAANIGDGASTSVTVTHSLNTRDVTVGLYTNASPWDEVEADIEHTDANTVTVRFAVAPAASAYRVVVHG